MLLAPTERFQYITCSSQHFVCIGRGNLQLRKKVVLKKFSVVHTLKNKNGFGKIFINTF